MPAAERFAEELPPESGLEHRAPRELEPYARPEMLPPPEDPTVPDLALRRSMMVPRIHDAPVPSDAPELVQSPFSGGEAAKPAPPARRDSRPGEMTTHATVPAEQRPLRSSLGAPPPVSVPVPAPEAPVRRVPVLLVLVLTALAAAALGASLGDGSLARAIERWGRARPESAPTALVAAPSAPRPVLTARPPERSLAPGSSARDVPVMRLDELPLAEHDEPADSAEPAPRRHAGRRVPAPH